MTHVEQLERYLETENAPQDVHNGAVLTLFALWLDDQENATQSTVFSGDASTSLWNAINSAQNVDKLQEALYLMGCYLQRFERMIKRRQ